MGKINQLKAGVVLSYLNILIGCIIPLFYTPIMLDLLGQSEYGLYSLSHSVTNFLSLLNFGMGSAVVRYIVRYKTNDDFLGVRRVFGFFLMIYSALAAIVCIGGVILASVSHIFFAEGLNSGEISKLRILIIIMSLNMAVTFIQSIFSFVAVSYEKYIFHKILALFATVAVPVFNLIALYMGFASVGLTVSSTLVQIICTVLFIIYVTKIVGLTPHFRQMPFHLFGELVKYCAFTFLSIIVDLLYWSTDKVLIGAIIGSAAVAVYNIGSVFSGMLQNMSSAISSVFTPRVNTIVASKAPVSELSELLIRIGRIQFLVVSLILSGYITFGESFVYYWAGEDYGDAYYVALLTMAPLAVPLIQSIAFSTIMAQNKHRFRAIAYAVIAVINLISTVIVLPRFGIIGAAACTGAAYILGNGIIMNIYYHKVIGLDIPLFWKNILKMSIVPIALSLAFCFLPVNSLWQLLAYIVLFTALFVVLSWFISLNCYEKELFGGIVKKFIFKNRGSADDQ